MADNVVVECKRAVSEGHHSKKRKKNASNMFLARRMWRTYLVVRPCVGYVYKRYYSSLRDRRFVYRADVIFFLVFSIRDAECLRRSDCNNSEVFHSS